MQSYKRNFERPNFPKITFKINTWTFSKETATEIVIIVNLSSVYIRPFTRPTHNSRYNSAYRLSSSTRYLWLPFLRFWCRDSTFRFRLSTTFCSGRR